MRISTAVLTKSFTFRLELRQQLGKKFNRFVNAKVNSRKMPFLAPMVVMNFSCIGQRCIVMYRQNVQTPFLGMIEERPPIVEITFIPARALQEPNCCSDHCRFQMPRNVHNEVLYKFTQSVPYSD